MYEKSIWQIVKDRVKLSACGQVWHRIGKLFVHLLHQVTAVTAVKALVLCEHFLYLPNEQLTASQGLRSVETIGFGISFWNTTHRMQVDQTTSEVSYKLLIKGRIRLPSGNLTFPHAPLQWGHTKQEGLLQANSVSDTSPPQMLAIPVNHSKVHRWFVY